MSLGNGLCLIEWLTRMVIYFIFSGHTLRVSSVDISLEIRPSSTTRTSVISISTLRYQPRDVNLVGAIWEPQKDGERFIFSLFVPTMVLYSIHITVMTFLRVRVCCSTITPMKNAAR